MDGYLSASDQLLVHEVKFWNEGFSFPAGIDEAGRGCLAGPVVAAAVVFTDHSRIPEGLNDSKKLTEAQREKLRERILSEPSILWGIGEVSAARIDEIDILRATWEAMALAASKVIPPADFILVDGNPVHGLPLPSQNLVKGDASSASIAAASILAKTHRDRLMEQAASDYPGYSFEIHKGYGTELHLDALKRLGVTPLHRKTFAPVREILFPPEFTQQELF